MGAWAKFRDTAASIGTGNALLMACARVAGALFGPRLRIVKYYFTVQPVTPPPEDRWRRTGSFALSWVDAGSPLLAEAERPADVIRSRFAQGARCLAAANDSGLAGFLWYVPGPYLEDEVRARFLPAPAGQSAWDFDVMVLPQYRMGRLFSYLWAAAGAELAAAGIRHTISRISAFNAASLASHRRLGATIVGSAVFVCIGRVQFMASTLAPRWNVSWRDDQRPTVVIAAA